MPPGAIGSRQLQRGGPLPGFFQPVEIKAPAGALISLASGDQFGRPAGGRPAAWACSSAPSTAARHQHPPAPRRRRPGGLPQHRGDRPALRPAGTGMPLRHSRRVDAPKTWNWRWPASSSPASSTWKTRTTPCPPAEIDKSQNWFEVAPGQDRWRRPTGWGVRWRSFAWAAGCPTQNPTADFSSARRRTCPARRRRRCRPRPRRSCAAGRSRQKDAAGARRSHRRRRPPPRRGNRSHERHLATLASSLAAGDHRPGGADPLLLPHRGRRRLATWRASGPTAMPPCRRRPSPASRPRPPPARRRVRRAWNRASPCPTRRPVPGRRRGSPGPGRPTNTSATAATSARR